jgi:hypothetical protein
VVGVTCQIHFAYHSFLSSLFAPPQPWDEMDTMTSAHGPLAFYYLIRSIGSNWSLSSQLA